MSNTQKFSKFSTKFQYIDSTSGSPKGIGISGVEQFVPQ